MRLELLCLSVCLVVFILGGIRLYKTKNPLHVFGLGMVMVTLGLFFSTVAFYGNASINQEARDYLKNIFLLYAGIGGNLVASWVLMRK